MNINFKALVVEELTNGNFERKIKTKNIADLPQNDVIVKVLFSSLNYKDALSATGNKGITRKYPHTPGIDISGIVEESKSELFQKGDEVIITGYDLGMNTDGGFSEYACVPAEWIVRKPAQISSRQSMIIGTAGFTAMSGILEILAHNIKPNDGKILVTGASGGVGLMAVTILSKLGYNVIAASGKAEHYDILRKAGAIEIIGREVLGAESPKPLLPQQWVAVIDTVGGLVLANAIKGTNKYGLVATCGSVISSELNISIFPFILRGVRLIGLASAETLMNKRLLIWDKLNEVLGKTDLEFLTKEVKLDDINQEIDLILKSKQIGRVIINMK
jgi:putative YhdH/YhfP family quinone oxidoreductase